MTDSRGETVQIRRVTGGGLVTCDPALAGELVGRGGWEYVKAAKPAPKSKGSDDK